jgi:lipoyl(octanoyl) transferase
VTFVVHNLGVTPYLKALGLQRRAVRRLQEHRGAEALYLLEHPHVITLGRNADAESLIAPADLLEQRGVEIIETDRGGDVTYHGPGQLVGYPVIKLETGRRDIRRYVHDIEEVLVRTLASFSIASERHPVHRGVWVDGRKIASVGIRISRWVTSHGFALNAHTDLSYFSLIRPCGIAGCIMTSMSRELGEEVPMTAVQTEFIRHFAEVFGREYAQESEGIGCNA